MKYIIILFFLVANYSFGQEITSKSAKTSFSVSGVCEMCKDRIEKGALKLKGVKYVNWNIISNKVSIIYNSKKIKLDNIHKEIALLGHSTDLQKATEDTYNNLPDCCQYKTESIH
jgi:cation transport ATPase|tara:strand:+ start:1392 stop:1736 length:345 start_codon:yes stop_codon:yes gene_type:complete